MNNDLKKLLEPKKPIGRPRKTPKKVIGRPKKDLDWQLVYQLATYHCTKSEIYAALKTSGNMIDYVPERRAKFDELYMRGYEDGKTRLRKAQARMSEKNPVMAIWCGKQYLNQSDNPQQNATVDGTIKVVFEDPDKDKDRLEKMENALKDELK